MHLLLEVSFLGAVILLAALKRTPLTMRIFAPKSTTQIAAPGITRMGQEEDSAVSATGQASPQTRLGPQNGPQDEIVLQHDGAYFALAVPIPAELEMFLDSYGKKPRFSLIILISFSTSSSYPVDTHVSRGRTRIFSLGRSPANQY